MQTTSRPLTTDLGRPRISKPYTSGYDASTRLYSTAEGFTNEHGWASLTRNVADGETLHIPDNRNVGIGTSRPRTALAVVGTASSKTNLLVGAAANTGTTINTRHFGNTKAASGEGIGSKRKSGDSQYGRGCTAIISGFFGYC